MKTKLRNVYKHYFYKMMVMTAIAITVLSLGACGDNDNASSSESGKGKTQSASYVYVPEYVELKDAEVARIEDAKIFGDFLYYTKIESEDSLSDGEDEQDLVRRFLCEYSLTQQKETRKMLLSEDSGFTYDFRVAEDGSVYVMDYALSDEGGQILVFDGQGELQMQLDFMKLLGARFSDRMAVDSQNRIYVALASSKDIALINADGTLSGTIPFKDKVVQSLGVGKDGKVYVGYFGEQLRDDGNLLAEIDFDGKKIGEKVYQNYPNTMHTNFIFGDDYDFLANDGRSLYGYSLETESSEKLFDWADCGVSKNPMGAFCLAEDGHVKVLTRSGIGKKAAEMTVLKKTDASLVPKKTELVLGALYAGGDLRAAVVAFNKQSDTCHITIKNYTDGDISDSEALQNMNIDIISANNCPDLFDLSHINVEALAQNGVFENLEPWLEQSSTLNREDYLENVLENYTYNGVLTAIPSTVTLYTLMGRTDMVGEKIGWTVDDMIALVDANPDAQLCTFDYNQGVLRDCLQFGSKSFIDWTTGRADFDCEEFKKLLIFANRYPSVDNWEFDGGNEDKKMQQGELLLEFAFIGAFQDIQTYDYQYGGVTFIGFPTADGSNGCKLFTSNACAMASKCEYKEEAWEFIEFLLSGEADEWSPDGFPCNKNDLAAKVSAVEYKKDNNGDLLLDLKGKPMLRYDTVQFNGGKRYEYHAVTEDEAALGFSLLESAQFVSSNDDVIYRIIYEEAEAFFHAQKSVDDVAAIIQNRVQLYLDENW